LGNIMATISDQQGAQNATLYSASDYAPFGMQLVGRRWNLSGGYRYGFNKKENDNEVKGDGNQIDYGMRIYDPRIGKFLSVDPLQKKYPDLTSYQFAGNNPIAGIDLDGREFEWFMAELLEKKIYGTTELKKYREDVAKGAIQRAKESVAGLQNIPGMIKEFFSDKDFGRTTIADPNVGKGQLERQIMTSVKAGVAIAKEYGELIDKAVHGDGQAVGALGFEAGMLFFPEEKAGLFAKGGTRKILEGAGELLVDAKKGKIDGFFMKNDQMVLFDADFKVNGKSIELSKVGIYAEDGFNTTRAQGSVGPAIFRDLLSEFESLLKQEGFEQGKIKYERVRPEGSDLPNSKPREINLNLKKDQKPH
ncbi:RHS repeat-associated protein, partial [Chitinophaga niastensis]